MSHGPRPTATRPCRVCGMQTRSMHQLCTEHRDQAPGGRRWRIRDDELREIARLARAGLTDAEIGARIGATREAVCKARQRHGIPAGVSPSHPVIAPPRRRTTSHPDPERATLTPAEQARAACRDADPDLFYESPNEKSFSQAAKARVAAAKAVCRACPVAVACLRVAVANDERWGIWAGLNAEERAQLRRRAAS